MIAEQCQSPLPSFIFLLTTVLGAIKLRIEIRRGYKWVISRRSHLFTVNCATMKVSLVILCALLGFSAAASEFPRKPQAIAQFDLPFPTCSPPWRTHHRRK